MSAATERPNDEQTEASRPTVGQAAVVFNPIKVDIDAIKESVARYEAEAGWPETLFFETSADDPGQGPTAEAIAAGATLVIAAGGDGLRP